MKEKCGLPPGAKSDMSKRETTPDGASVSTGPAACLASGWRVGLWTTPLLLIPLRKIDANRRGGADFGAGV
jgi:hypothetical protein